MATTSDGHLEFIEQIAKEDAAGLLKAHESYGDSWKKRGGIGAYHSMVRKFDRMENAVKKFGYDIVAAVEADQRPEGLVDDIRDARRYLMLIESWLRELGLVRAGDHRDNYLSQADNIHEGEVPRSYSDLDVDVNMSDMLENDPRCVALPEPFRTDRKHKKSRLDVELSMNKANKELGITCSAHIPDAACACTRCEAMRRLVQTPHIKDCGCENCGAVKQTVDRLKQEQIELAAKGMKLHVEGRMISEDSAEHADLEACRREQHRKICRGCDDPAHNQHQAAEMLRTDRQYKEPVTTIINEIDHPDGCDCVTCKGVRGAEVLDRERARLSSGLCEICVDRNAPSCDHCDITKQAKAWVGSRRGIYERAVRDAAEKRLYEDNLHPPQCGCNQCLAEHNEPCSHECGHVECQKARGITG